MLHRHVPSGSGSQPSGRSPGSPQRSRLQALAGLAAGAAVLTSLAGCSQVDAKFGRQWGLVLFHARTPSAQVAEIAAGCRHLPGVGVRPVYRADGTVTGITLHAGSAGHFSRRALREIYSCLGQFPAVAGVSVRQVAP